MVFYDLTSTYFEGQGPPDLGAHGHSHDSKPRSRQMRVGLIMVDVDWPIAYHVFAGNRRDGKTIPGVLHDLEARFGLKRSCLSVTAASCRRSPGQALAGMS